MRTICFAILPAFLAGCSEAAPPALREPERRVTAEEIFSIFTTNELAAKRDFERSPFTVSGKVVLVSEETIMLDTSAGPQVGLNMLPGHTDEMAKLQAGETFAADCEGAYKVKTVIGLFDCRPHTERP